MWHQRLEKLNLPELLSREEMLNILQQEEYGFMPPEPDKIKWVEDENYRPGIYCAGKASIKKINAVCTINGKEFSFPFYCSLPSKPGKHPFFVSVNFRDNIPDLYLPAEEINDNGFAFLSFCHNDVTKDNDDFTDGLASVLFENGKRSATDCGKIAMWAWAAQRLMDYAETISDVLDLNRAVVCGHSRLGKTALLAAATDERFKFCYSNDSGCSGAAITRNKQGETVKFICEAFPFWFCENYKKYIDNETNMPFDQHFLIASIAPRPVCVGSATADLWADPESEFLACIAASKAYGENGFVFEDRKIKSGDKFFEGNIGYHLREGEHYFGREDWQRLIEFANKHI